MIRWALGRAIDKFERDGDSHASHTRHMIDASLRPAWADRRGHRGAGSSPFRRSHQQRQGATRGHRGLVVLGLIGFVIGGLVVATANGGLGTGNGLGGGVVAMMVGLIGMVLGGSGRSPSHHGRS
jgi:hypothetical protein